MKVVDGVGNEVDGMVLQHCLACGYIRVERYDANAFESREWAGCPICALRQQLENVKEAL